MHPQGSMPCKQQSDIPTPPPPLLLTGYVVCGACASSNKVGKYCTMCATPHPMRKVVLAKLAADVASSAAALAVPREVVKAIFLRRHPGQSLTCPRQLLMCLRRWQNFWGSCRRTHAGVKECKGARGKEGKGDEGECAPVKTDVAVSAEVVPVPVPVAKAKGP